MLAPILAALLALGGGLWGWGAHASVVHAVVSANCRESYVGCSIGQMADLHSRTKLDPSRVAKGVDVLPAPPEIEAPFPMANFAKFRAANRHLAGGAGALAWPQNQYAGFFRGLAGWEIELIWQRAFEETPINVALKVYCWRLSGIYPLDLKPAFDNLFALVPHPIHVEFIDSHIGSKLPLRAQAVLAQVQNERRQSATSKHRLHDDGPEHPLGPFRHALLCRNIPPLALVALIPIGIALLYAGLFKLISYAAERKQVRWAILGWLSSLLGAGLIAGAITGWLSL